MQAAPKSVAEADVAADAVFDPLASFAADLEATARGDGPVEAQAQRRGEAPEEVLHVGVHVAFDQADADARRVFVNADDVAAGERDAELRAESVGLRSRAGSSGGRAWDPGDSARSAR